MRSKGLSHGCCSSVATKLHRTVRPRWCEVPLSEVVSETSQLASNEWNGRAAIAAERESEQLDAGIHQQPAPAVGAYLAQLVILGTDCARTAYSLAVGPK